MCRFLLTNCDLGMPYFLGERTIHTTYKIKLMKERSSDNTGTALFREE